MVRQTARVLIFEILGGLLFLAVLAAAFLAWRLSQGPLQLDAFQDDIERALTEARAGRAVDVGSVQLEWSPERRRVDVTAREITFYTEAGEVGGTAALAQIELDASALLIGDVDVLSVALTRGEIEVHQLSADTWSVGGERLPPIPTAAFPTTPEEWLDAINRALTASLAGGDMASEAVQLSEVSFEDFDISITLMDGVELARFSAASGSLTRIGQDLALTVSASGASEGAPDSLTAVYVTENAFSGLRFQVAVEGWSLPDLARRLGAPEAMATGLPAHLVLSSNATREGGLQTLDLLARAESGAVRLAGQSVPISRIDATASYDTASDLLVLDFDTLDAGLVRGAVTAEIADAIRGEGDRVIELRAPELRIDATPFFAVPWQLRNVELDLRVSQGFETVRIDRARLRVDGADLAASGTLTREPPPEPGDLPFSLNLAAELTGETGAETVLAFWPVRLGAGARRFVENNVEAGRLIGATARLSIAPQSMRSGHLPDEALEVDFTVRGAQVRFLSDMPEVRDGVGTGRLTGNSFAVNVVSGSWANWEIETGRVAIPELNPKGGDMIVSAEGRGAIADAVIPIFRSRLNLEAESGFNPERLSGRGELSFNMTRPALDNVPMQDVSFSVTGQVSGAGVQDVLGTHDLTNATGRVDITQDRLAITGFGEVGPASVNFEWRDVFDDGGAPSRLTARSTVTPDILNAFGLLGRPYISGEVPVELSAGILGEGVSTSDVVLDFTDARIDLAEIGWLKPPGDPARAEIVYRHPGDMYDVTARLVSQRALLEGDFQLSESGRLIAADVERAFLEGRADVSGQVSRSADGGLSLSLSGPLLDVSGALPSPMSLSGGGAISGRITMDAEVDRLVVSDVLQLRQARIAAISTLEGLQSVNVSGDLPAGGDFNAEYSGAAPGESARFKLEAGDAGALIATFFDTDVLIGGALSLNGVLRAEDEVSDFDIRIRGARLRDAPFLTQILSLASLRGLSDTLGGEGVLFSEIDMPLRAGGGRFVIEGGRASGPALGLTVNGWVEPEVGGVSLDGVLVPSFGVNSALGGVPIIGDLFVGREGEGVFSLTYSVRGQLDRAQVAVNPLSAVTPGILRRIFENPSSTELPLPESPPGED